MDLDFWNIIVREELWFDTLLLLMKNVCVQSAKSKMEIEQRKVVK